MHPADEDKLSMPDYSGQAFSDIFLDQAILVNCSFATIGKMLEQSVKSKAANVADADVFLDLSEKLTHDRRYRRFLIWLKRHASERVRYLLDIE